MPRAADVFQTASLPSGSRCLPAAILIRHAKRHSRGRLKTERPSENETSPALKRIPGFQTA
ncbi:hypothetical protein [Neisseria bacilliformis]|uniref:hypothetical protein n=1 Tax=Neisseria bacilliformis TaxID=267212 RepID=UPI00128C57F1|nr:hypothetical protein [Neisseria bacilliformis]